VLERRRLVPVPRRDVPVAAEAPAAAIGRLAIRSLYREVALPIKPGLVGPQGSGSHKDMNYQTFLRSLQSLRGYFPAIAAAGALRPGFDPLKNLGIEAECIMLAATGGINTHRGAIFNLGLLCAAVGWLMESGEAITPEAACALVARQWGADVLAGAALPGLVSHGQWVAKRYGSGGARQEAASGFPAAIEVGLPAYRDGLRLTGEGEAAATQALFALMAALEDTNLLWRGGPEGLEWARQTAAGFLAAGGVAHPDWRSLVAGIDHQFTARRLSPGGSADLLGITLFLADLGQLA